MSDIVIDADVMRAAGESQHPHSKNARMVLEAISEGGHKMVQCAPLKAEHDRHASLFSSIWRGKMVARRQMIHWKYQEDSGLRKTLVQPLSPKEEIAALKDAHLLETAAATGRRIVSKDVTARNLFRLSCPDLGNHRNLLWGDLTLEPEKVIEWINDGCQEENELKLCPSPPRKSPQRNS